MSGVRDRRLGAVFPHLAQYQLLCARKHALSGILTRGLHPVFFSPMLRGLLETPTVHLAQFTFSFIRGN